jgi:hypothetical protein
MGKNMKQIHHHLLIAAIILLSTAFDAMAEGSKAIALAYKVQGKPEFTRGEKTTALKFGTVLDDGDLVKTGKEGFVTLLFTDDKSLLKLTEFSEVKIEGTRKQDGSISKRVSMEIGELFAKVEKQRGVLEVATPTSVASVKGTEFWVVVDENGNTHVTTLEGLVELMNRLNGQVIEVREAQKGEVDEQGNMQVNDVPKDELKGDPDPGGEPQGEGGGDQKTETIEIQYEDEEGNTRTMRIEYQPKEENK